MAAHDALQNAIGRAERQQRLMREDRSKAVRAMRRGNRGI